MCDIVGDEECDQISGMEHEDEEEMEDGEPDQVEAPQPEEELNNQVCSCVPVCMVSGVWVSVFLRHLLLCFYYVCTYIHTLYMKCTCLLEVEVTDGQSMESSSKYGTEAALSDDHLPSNSSTQPDMQVCIPVTYLSHQKHGKCGLSYRVPFVLSNCVVPGKGVLYTLFIVSLPGQYGGWTEE